MPDKPKLIWQPGALDDLSRLREFLQSKNPKAAINNENLKQNQLVLWVPLNKGT